LLDDFVYSGFLFLRLICPALLKPQLFDLMTGLFCKAIPFLNSYSCFALDSLSATAERTLKLIAKYLQNLANQVEFRTKVRLLYITVVLVIAMTLTL